MFVTASLPPFGTTLQTEDPPTVDDDASNSDAPIGLFDSGVGGLSVYTHLKKVLPNESYVYYADLLHVPYGHRSSQEITHLTLVAVDWLVNVGCKLIVIACNSASAHALDIARHRYPNVPIVGLVPALKPAVLNSQSKNVAVLATKATLEGALLNDVIKDYAIPANVNVIKCFNPNLVPWVEAGMQADSETARQLKIQLHDFAKQHIDYLVLGCTHYPFFKDFVVEEVAKHNLGISVVDSGAAIASRVKELLSAHQKFAKRSKTINGIDGEDIYFNAISCKAEVNFETSPEVESMKAKPSIPAHTKLAFFATSANGNLNEVSQLVRRLVVD